MKIFFVVLIVSAILGGFVGAEILDKDFSITGAVIGFVLVGAVLLGLGDKWPQSFGQQYVRINKVTVLPSYAALAANG
jgi:hypothetical protein